MRVLTGWPVPVFLVLVFAALLSTSDAPPAGMIAAAFGLGLVLLLWAMFREFSVHADLSRAIAIGDGKAAAGLAEAQLSRRRRGSKRGPFSIYRAMAHELCGEWAAIEPTLAEARPETLRGTGGGASWQQVAHCLRVGAWCELGELARARATFDDDIAPRLAERGTTGSIFATLTEGRLRFAEGDLEGAQERLLPLTRNIRLGPSQRAIAFHYLARCAAALGQRAEAEKLSAQAAALAPTSWFAEPLPAAAAAPATPDTPTTADTPATSDTSDTAATAAAAATS